MFEDDMVGKRLMFSTGRETECMSGPTVWDENLGRRELQNRNGMVIPRRCASLSSSQSKASSLPKVQTES